MIFKMFDLKPVFINILRSSKTIKKHVMTQLGLSELVLVGAGGEVQGPPDFDRSAIPISTRWQIIPTIIIDTCPPPVFQGHSTDLAIRRILTKMHSCLAGTYIAPRI